MIVDPEDAMVILAALKAHRHILKEHIGHLLDGNQELNAELIVGCRERIAHIDRIAEKIRRENEHRA